MAYFGEGAASEGDFHPALNFAATLRAQTLFFCRNNMYAISTPIDDQYAGDGIAIRGISYGMPTIRVDGNDIFAVHAAVEEARKIIMTRKMPVLIESISYRIGDHSTSDFSKTYRHDKEMEKWEQHLTDFGNPITRLEKYLLKAGHITAAQNQELRDAARTAVRDSLKKAIAEPKGSIDEMFEDVYETIPQHIAE